MKTTEQLTVEDANAEFYKALESGSSSRTSDLWIQEDWVRCVHPGWDMVVGWKNVAESLDRIFEEGPNMRISPTSVKSSIFGNIALVTCVENITVFQESNFDSMQAVATNVFLSRDNRWMMVHHHASPVPLLVPDTTVDTIQ